MQKFEKIICMTVTRGGQSCSGRTNRLTTPHLRPSGKHLYTYRPAEGSILRRDQKEGCTSVKETRLKKSQLVENWAAVIETHDRVLL